MIRVPVCGPKNPFNTLFGVRYPILIHRIESFYGLGYTVLLQPTRITGRPPTPTQIKLRTYPPRFVEYRAIKKVAHGGFAIH